MSILNMVYSTSGGGGPNIPLDAIDDLSVAPGNTEATLKWTDPGDLVVRGYTLTSWVSTKLVRKAGSAPSSSSDGTLVLTETVRDQYSSTGYTDTGLTNGTTYYYAAFAVGDNGTESISDVRSVTPTGGWIPGADTIGYYPLTSTTQGTDQSGNGRDFTANGTVTYGTYGGVDCCYVNQGQLNYMFSNSGDWLPSSGNYTISLWYYHVANPSQDNGQMAQFSQGSNMGDSRIGMDIPVTWPSYVSNKPGLAIITSSGGNFSSPAISLTQNAWHHCVVTKNSSTLTLYVNGVSSASANYGGYGDLGNYGISRDETYTRSIIGYVSEAIFEKKAWTAQEIADYFDDTKGNYGGGGLPSTYQEVEWIGSSGTQRIDTGVVLDDFTYGFETKFNFTSVQGDWNIMNATDSSYRYRYGFGGYNSNNWQIGNMGPGDGCVVYTTSNLPTTGVDYTAIYNYNGNYKWNLNGSDLVTFTPTSLPYTGAKWNIFCQMLGNNSNPVRFGSYKLYYMKIYHGTTLLRDYVPCYRKSDNVIGLYDLVNDVFYTNDGSGTFTKGNDVN